jgi:hypothetical protein
MDVRAGVLSLLVFSTAMAACTEAPNADVPPVVIHVRQPNSLMPDWEHDAVFTAFDAACPEESPGRVGWRTTSIDPRPSGPNGPLPVKMTGTIRCDDGSRHAVVVLFDAPT